MYAEAIAEGRRTNEIQPHSRSFSFLGYALAKSGNREAARSELANMLEQSKAKWVSPYSVALVYAGLEDREQTIEWLERGLQQRDQGWYFYRPSRSGTCFVTTRAFRNSYARSVFRHRPPSERGT